jgi:probable rRNA maturation factor
MKALADRLLRDEHCEENVEVSILLTDDRHIAKLNRQYRGVDGPTDVLAFAQVEPDDGFSVDSEENLLGDVVISVETAMRQAEEHGHGLDEEIDVLLAHGLLHLLGYDHAEPEQERRMFERQAEIVKRA